MTNPYRIPHYPNDTDYTTNAASYYDDLARKNTLMKHLAQRIWEYDKELAKRFLQWEENLATINEDVIKMMERWMADGTLEDIINEAIFSDLNGQIQSLQELLGAIHATAETENQVYTIGDGGDFQTITAALNRVDTFLIPPKRVELQLQGDFTMREQLLIEGKDYSFVTITSMTDVPAVLSPAITTITTWNNTAYTPFIYVRNGKAPVIDFLLDYASNYTATTPRVSGLVAENSDIFIEKGKGFTGFPWGGLVLLDHSNGIAVEGVFNGNGNFPQVTPTKENVRTAYEGKGVLVQNSTFTGDRLQANDCGDVGVHVQLASQARFSYAEITGCGHHAIVVSQASNATARNGIYTDTQDDNVVCETGSHLDISYSDCSRSVFTNGIVAHSNGNITFMEGIANGCGERGIHCVNDGHVNAEGTTVENNKNSGISLGRMGYVYFRFGKARNNAISGINIESLSHVIALDSEISGNGDNGVTNKGGEIDVKGCTITGNGVNGVGTYTGGTSHLEGTTISGNGQFGVSCENAQTNIRASSIQNNTDVDVRISMGGKVTGENITTTPTTRAMYVLSTSAMAQISNSPGYANIEPNVVNIRGLLLSNSLQLEVTP